MPQSTDKKLIRRVTPRNTYSASRLKTDTIFALDYYYVLAINDAIETVRAGDVAYLFFEYQLYELARFVKNIDIHIVDGIYHVFQQGTQPVEGERGCSNR